jgi:hypothetical protein
VRLAEACKTEHDIPVIARHEQGGPAMVRRMWTLVGALAVCALVVTACGSGGSSNNNSNGSSGTPKAGQSTGQSSSSGNPKAEIKSNWQSFFRHSNPTEKSLAVLQHGQQFKDVVLKQKKSTLAKTAAAKVTKIKLVSPKKAKVTYTISTGGTPVLPHQKGVALKINGTWKISAASFCALLHLESVKAKACPSSGSSS